MEGQVVSKTWYDYEARFWCYCSCLGLHDFGKFHGFNSDLLPADVDLRSDTCDKKSFYKCQGSQRNFPFKKRKFFDLNCGSNSGGEIGGNSSGWCCIIQMFFLCSNFFSYQNHHMLMHPYFHSILSEQMVEKHHQWMVSIHHTKLQIPMVLDLLMENLHLVV